MFSPLLREDYPGLWLSNRRFRFASRLTDHHIRKHRHDKRRMALVMTMFSFLCSLRITRFAFVCAAVRMIMFMLNSCVPRRMLAEPTRELMFSSCHEVVQHSIILHRVHRQARRNIPRPTSLSTEYVHLVTLLA